MDRTDLAARIAQQFDTTLERAENIVKATLDTISAALREKEIVRLRGFGTFSIVKWGDVEWIKFRASRHIKRSLNQRSTDEF